MGKYSYLILIFFINFWSFGVFSSTCDAAQDEVVKIENEVDAAEIKPEDIASTKSTNLSEPIQTGLKKPETVPHYYSLFQKILYIAAKVKAIQFYCILF